MQASFVRSVSVVALLLALINVSVCQDDIVELVLGLLTDDDKELRSLAYEQIRSDVQGAEATKQFASQLALLQGEARVGLLSALADRGDDTAKSAILRMLTETTNQAETVAAISAIGALGDASDCGTLVKKLTATRPVRQAARTSLIQLGGDGVTESLVAEFHRGGDTTKLEIMEILTERRAKDALPDLLKWSTSKTPIFRKAAMVALGQLASPEHIPAMLPGVLKATRGPERSAAEKSVMLVANREPERESRARPILSALPSFSKQQRLHLLPTLGRVGGKRALKEVQRSLESRDTAAHSAGIVAISNWPDASVSDTLIALAKSDWHANHRTIALRALIRVAPLADGRADEEKLELLQTAFQMSARDSEKKLVIRRASAIRTIETLRFLLPYLAQPNYTEEACQAIVELAHHRQLRDDNKPEFHQALDKVMASSKNATVLERADRYKKGQTWARPK